MSEAQVKTAPKPGAAGVHGSSRIGSRAERCLVRGRRVTGARLGDGEAALMQDQERGFPPPRAATLEDLLRTGLDVVFVGINPSIYSVERGHYFARRGNKFWPCVSRSVLTEAARAGIGVDVLGPQNDRALPAYGIGFTDLVKRATPKAADVAPGEFVAAVAILLAKLETCRPRIACFHGITGYRYVRRHFAADRRPFALGLQDVVLGETRFFVLPNPSGANAHFTRDEQTRWYDDLAREIADRTGGGGSVAARK